MWAPFLWVATFAWALLSGVSASPVRQASTCGPSICRAEDPGPEQKFHYKEGSVYSYTYVVNGTTSVLGGPSKQSGLHLSAKVSLRFLTACDVLLFISDMSILQSHLDGDGMQPNYVLPVNRLPFIKSMEQFPLRFSYADGEVQEICPHSEESSWGLNIKRGILSAFQNTMRRLDLEHRSREDDVHGNCKVEYQLGAATSSSLNIRKDKDLNSCGDRFGVLSAVQGSPYSFGSLHQSMPAVESKSFCEHTVDRNLLAGIQCSESHRLQSLSRGAAGAYMTIRQRLDLISMYIPPLLPSPNATSASPSEDFAAFDDEDQDEDEDGEEGNPLKEDKKGDDGGDRGGSPPWIVLTEPDEYFGLLLNKSTEKILRRETLIFHHDYNLGQMRTDYSVARNALANFCEATKKEVGEMAGELFEILIYILRGLSPNDMMSLSKDASEICKGDRDPFDDALEVVGTAASLAVIRERILKGDSKPERTHSWVNSLTFIPKPDLFLLTEAVSILRARDNYPNILLSFSSLANSYCRNVGYDICQNDQPVALLGKLYEKYFAATGCVTKRRKEMEQVMMYLKGIGNFGVFSNGTAASLRTCITKNDKSEVRVQAIEALRRMPCKDTSAMGSLLQSVFQDQLQDAEVRIAAFIGIMRCPSYPTIRWIRKALEDEEVNQVGSFVWTFLTNLQETALPSRAELQALLADEMLSTKFASDIRKFSRNFELSTFYEDMNLGMALDGNLVFSQNSYIPRSASANLTVDLFGESVNVLEATVRIENFENYVESLLGTTGKTSGKRVKDSPRPRQKGKKRERRGAINRRQLRTLATENETMKRYYSDPIASLSMRTFGSEFYYKRLVGLGEQKMALSKLNIFEGLLSNKEDTTWQKSKLLLDSSYIIPTGIGLPLNLSAQASAIIRHESESLFDTSSTGRMKVKGKFIPSAMLAVAGSMTLTASDIHTGLKIKAHLRSSLAVEGTFHVEGRSLVDIEFGLPKSHLELLEYKSELMFMEGDEFRGTKADKVPQGKTSTSCTGGWAYKYFGIKLCSASQFSLRPHGVESSEDEGDPSSPYFPLNGPSQFILSLEKANPSLLKTRFFYEWNNNQTNIELNLASITLSGQNMASTNEEKLGVSFGWDKLSQNLKTEILLPGHRLSASGQVQSDWSTADFNFDVEKGGSSIFSTSASFATAIQAGGMKKTKPFLLIKKYNQEVLKADGEILVTEQPGSKTFAGVGKAIYGRSEIGLKLDGGRNDSGITFEWEASYGNGHKIEGSSRFLRLGQRGSDDFSTNGGLDSSFSIEMSQFPNYNFITAVKVQTTEEDLDYRLEYSQGPNYLLGDRHPSNAVVKMTGSTHRSHEGSTTTAGIRVLKASYGVDWNLAGSLSTYGKSFNSTISVGYATGKILESSLMVKRSPGVLAFLEVGWNVTLPSREPLGVSLHIEETAHRVYEVQLELDWLRDKVLIDVEYSDKSRRTRIDTSLSVGVTTRSIGSVKGGFRIYSEDKETKLQFSSEYANETYALELGYNEAGRTGNKHKIVGSLTVGENVYLLITEVDLENGIQFVLKTVLGPKFTDILARVSAVSSGRSQLLGIEYRWHDSASSSKPNIFLAEIGMEYDRKSTRRISTVFTLPGYSSSGNLELGYEPERWSGKALGKLTWKSLEDEGHLLFNGRLGPRKEDNDDAYDVALHLSSPFPNIRNASLVVELDFLDGGNLCQMKVDSSWGDKGKVEGTLVGRLVPIEEIPEEKESDADAEDGSTSDDAENDLEEKKTRSFKLNLDGNFSSSIPSVETITVKLVHVFHDYLNMKTDVDIQLPNNKELSMNSNWVIPRRWSDLLATRAEVHFKTPFVGIQNADMQLILGRKEDKDVLALIGIYVENFQYAVSITGTPRFEDDGALGFEVTTSNPKYDKIFGSFSYVMGDTGRVALQFGWPSVVIGLETGWEWLHWGDFNYYFTVNTPWVPVKNIEALLRMDSTQSIELKLEANEDSITSKGEWIVLSWSNFDIRLNGNTPFKRARKFGFVLLNSWEDEFTYETQALGWVNEQQVGFKLDGGQSEVEEEDLFAKVLNSQLEVHSLIYPTVRGQFSLTQREARFSVMASLTLREGPINLEAQLHLLDIFRFNENITVTTPYPGLLQLDIGLSPAIVLDKKLYNLGVETKWRSYADSYTAGLFLRLGPQEELSKILTQEAQDAAFLGGGGGGDGDYEDLEKEVEEESEVETVEVPRSQLFHFYSPIAWMKTVKLEYEDLPVKDIDNDDEDVLPIRKIETIFSSDMGEVRTKLLNEDERKSLSGLLDLRINEDSRSSFKMEAELDSSESEKQLHLLAAADSKEYSLTSSWTPNLPQFFQGKVETRTPVDTWEEQSGTLMYAHNLEEKTYSVDVELSSLSFDKFSTNAMLGPRTFSVTVSGSEGIEELELRGDINAKEGTDDVVTTVITFKSGEKEMEVDVESTLSNEGWPTDVKGTISTTFPRLESFANGNVNGNIRKVDDDVHADGDIEWQNKKKLTATLYLSLPNGQLQNFSMVVQPPFMGNKNWEVLIDRESDGEQQTINFLATTPLPELLKVQGQFSLEMVEGSVLEMKKILLKADAPFGNFGANSSWALTSWNDCNFFFESKYVLVQNQTFANLPRLLLKLPIESGLKLRFKNAIPTLNRFTSVDTRFMLERMRPVYRIGAGVTSELVEDKSFSFKAYSKRNRAAALIDISSSFEDDLDISIKMDANSSLLTAKAEINILEEEEMTYVGNGKVEWGNKTLVSSFGCSWPEDSETSECNLRLSDSGTNNDTDSTIMAVRGSFNRVAKRRSARLQVGQDGKNPAVVDLDFTLKSVKDFASVVNISNISPIARAGITLANKKDGPIFDGVVGGHWNEDNLHLKYYWDYERTDDKLRFNVSLDTEIPFEFDSAPKPQLASFSGIYNRVQQGLKTNSEFRGAYNRVELFHFVHESAVTSVAGLDKVVTELELDNHFWPFKMIHLDQFEYSGGHQGLNLPTKSLQRITLWDLKTPGAEKVEGEIQLKANFTGGEVILMGHNTKKKLTLSSDYDLKDHQLSHATRFSWDSGSWLGYEIDVFNKTYEGRVEHEVDFRLSYPLRIVTLRSGYKVKGSSLRWTTDVNFNKGVAGNLKGVLDWDVEQGTSSTIRKLGLGLTHPSLSQGIRADGKLETDGWNLIKGRVDLDYSVEMDRKVTLRFGASPQLLTPLHWGTIPHWNFTADAHLSHRATTLDMRGLLGSIHSDQVFSTTGELSVLNMRKRAAEESKFLFEILKDVNKVTILTLDPDEAFKLTGRFSGEHPVFMIEGEADVSGVTPRPQTVMVVDLSKPYLKFYAIHGKNLSNGLYAEGGIMDTRNVKFDVWESHNNFKFSDVSFFFRLNHSRLLTSKLKWRPELFTEIKTLGQDLYGNVSEILETKKDQWINSLLNDATAAYTDVWADAKKTVLPFWTVITSESNFTNDLVALQEFLNETFEQNDFYVQEVLNYSQLIVEEISFRVDGWIEKIKSYRDEMTWEWYQSLEEAWEWVVTTARDNYNQTITAWKNYSFDPWSGISSSKVVAEIKDKLYLVGYYSIGFVFKVGEAMYHSVSNLLSSLVLELGTVLERNQPEILAHLHEIENFIYDFVVKISDYLYERREEMMKSSYYNKLAQTAEDFDALYRELSQNDAVSNIKMLYGKVKSFFARKLTELHQWVPWMKIEEKVRALWEDITGLEWVEEVKQELERLWAKTTWLMDYTNLDESIQELVVIILAKGRDLFSQSVLEAGARHQTAKTKFIFDADKGILSLEQKLPMPWAAFNETPDFEQLPEYQSLVKWGDFFKSSKSSLLDFYYKKQSGHLSSLLPPFDGYAMTIGTEYIVTFDGLAYNLGNSSQTCNYVLAADLVDGNFSVTLEVQNEQNYSIFVTVGHNTLVFDMERKGIWDPKRGVQLVNLPLNTPNFRAFQDGMNTVIESFKGIVITCKFAHRICQFHLSGWYSRKVGGILGTMDEEPNTDLTLNSGKRGTVVEDMITSWQFQDDNSNSKCLRNSKKASLIKNVTNSTSPVCYKLFRSKASNLQPCFATVKPDVFYDMCLAEDSSKTISLCTVANAYLTACVAHNVHLQTPSICVRCEMNGEEMMEREMKVISSPPPGSPSSTLSTDVVLIVEAKECNRALRSRKKIDMLMKHLEEELKRKNFKNNRYAAVVFGGDGVYDKPHPIVQQNQVFTDSVTIGKYLASLPAGNGNEDTFGAITYTLQRLNFRAGVSKTLLLFPCSSCHPQQMTVEYADLYYDMLMHGAKLHVLMNGNFVVDNKNLGKKVLGVDTGSVYMKEVKSVDIVVRRQIKIPKKVLGYCTPLALQTNGSIFTTKKLQTKQESTTSIFSTMLGQRVAETASPSSCQSCYCSSGGSDGISRIECFECGYPRYDNDPRPEDDLDLDMETDDSENLDDDDEEDSDAEE